MLVMGDGDPRALITSAGGALTARAWCTAVGQPPLAGFWHPAGRWVGAQSAEASPDARGTGVCVVVETGPDAGLSAPLPRGDSLVGRAAPANTPGARLGLRAPGVARRHARLRVETDGVVVSPVDGTVRVAGRTIAAPTLVDERALVACGDDRLRVLPSRPVLPPRPHGDPAELEPGPALPRMPWLALIAAIAPLGIGAALWWATGSWFMLLFGCLGLLTAGPLALADLGKRRRLRRGSRARALKAADEASAAYPAPGSFLAAWGASPLPRADKPGPAADGARPAESRFQARLGPLRRPLVRVRETDPAARGTRHRVPPLQMLLQPLPGERVGVRGPPELSDPLLRVILAWWIAGLRPGDVLELAPDPAWPAGALCLPGVRLTDLPGPTLARLA